MKSSFTKIIRFIKIYGLLRTIVKVAGRARLAIPIWWMLLFRYPIKNGPKVGIIGCGQFSYSAIAYFLSTSTKCKLEWCSDINLDASKSFAAAYGLKKHSNDCTEYLKGTDLVYIASNHASHTDYALQCLNAGCDVYIEKPISTTWEQFTQLLEVADNSTNKIYVGYNRPHSPSINLIRKNVKDPSLPFTLSCFVTGHFIPKDHWYRDPKEGTRVCGNLGHWLDLSVHMIYWSGQGIPAINVSISYSDTNTPSDNFCVTLTTKRGDLISLTFSSRSEPFEGVNESINFQQGDLIAKIDDHRYTQIWVNEKLIRKKHWPKNVGHKNAILQPFQTANMRQWDELVVSTKLMLIITDMVKKLETTSVYEF